MKFFFVVFLFIFTVAHADFEFGMVNSFSGKPEILRQGQKFEVKVGTKVFKGDLISCNENCMLKIVTLDRNVIQLGSNTQIEISEYINANPPKYGKVDIKLENGLVRSTLKQKYDEENHYIIKTPIATAGVRGTDFFVEHDPIENESSASTLKGYVEFGPYVENHKLANSVRIKAGHRARLNLKDKTPHAEKISQKILNRFKERLQDNKESFSIKDRSEDKIKNLRENRLERIKAKRN